MTGWDGVPQRERALELANQGRRARAELKARVAAGQLDAAEVILTSPVGSDGMRVAQLLVSQRGWGQTRCRAFLARVALHEHTRIGTLTERQRGAIASLLSYGSARARFDGATS